jgi:hypothetical protein
MDIIALLFILLIGLLFIGSFSSQLSVKDSKTLKWLFFYHLLFGVYYCFFVRGDAVGYWQYPKSMNYTDVIRLLTDQQGTYFLYSLNFFPSNLLNLSYFTGTMLYSLLGFIGLTYFYVITLQNIPYNSKFRKYNLFPLVFFMPMLNFWSAGVGKDTMLFFCIGIFVYGTLKPLQRLPHLLFSLGLSYFIRPHMTLFMVMGFGLAYITGSKISKFQRILFASIMIGVAVAILPSVMSFAKVEEASVDSFNEFSENKAALLSHKLVGSAIDISSYPFPLKVFTFLFRPLFFDINGLPAAVASVENLLLLLLSYKAFKKDTVKTFTNAPFVVKGLLYFLLIGTLAFSQSLGNLGVMIRMRNMFLPGLLIYILWAFSYQKQLAINKKKAMNR